MPGYWTQSEDSGLVLSCDAPAEVRCLGWDAAAQVSGCGAEYDSEAPACAKCAKGRYPLASGRCELCPTDPSAWLLIKPILIYIGGVAGAFLVLMLTVGVVAFMHSIPLAVAAKRTA